MAPGEEEKALAAASPSANAACRASLRLTPAASLVSRSTATSASAAAERAAICAMSARVTSRAPFNSVIFCSRAAFEVAASLRAATSRELASAHALATATSVAAFVSAIAASFAALHYTRDEGRIEMDEKRWLVVRVCKANESGSCPR